MATTGNSSNGLSHLPIFKGAKYQFWELKMQTLFKSQELCELVDQGFNDPKPAEPVAQLKEKRKKDAKALFIIQQALDEEVFPRIASATTAKEAWDILKSEYLGDKKVVKVRLQSLRREFETALMGDIESAQDYLSRISSVVQQMKAYGEKITDEHIVGKVLRSLTSKYDNVVAAIEESKDLESYTFEELMGSLQSHEERMNRGAEKKEEKAFQAKEESNSDRSSKSSGRGKIRGGFRGRGCGRSSGQSSEIQSSGAQSSRGPIKCYYCTKPGHKEANCGQKEKDQKKSDPKVNVAETEERLFLTSNGAHEIAENVWYIDSGCSNHMSSTKSMFKDLDESKTSKVRLGDDKQLIVEGVGTVAIKTEQGGMNGSIIYELDRPENAGLEKSVKVIAKVKRELDEREQVSWADMIAVAGAEAVSFCGGPIIPVELGRVDSMLPDPEGKLPEETLDATSLKQCFLRKGFSTQELVVLSGAHTLGGKGFGNPVAFDNSYFKILLEKPWASPASMSSMIGLPSDRTLSEDDECLRWIRIYAGDQKIFFDHFKDAYVKLVNSGASWKSI